MKGRKWLFLICLSAFVWMVAACSGGNDETTGDQSIEGESSEGETSEAVSPEDLEGDLTILIHRTDIVDTVFEGYKEAFQERHPNVEISFEAITDYQGQVNIRMNTTDYGDVLMLPDNILPRDFPTFFEPLGNTDELLEKYLFADIASFERVTYGIPITINANGIVYNKDIFEEAGVTEIPSTHEEFIEAMKLVKENTDAIPLYTNYGDTWPLSQWEANRLSISGDPDFNNELVRTARPFEEGEPHYQLYKLMYDVVEQELTENDPLTTDWESSKQMLANGEIATMVLGSWAITQIQDMAADPSSIGYMPFPYTHDDGTIYSTVGSDFAVGINVHSDSKEAARAWIDYFVDESNYAVDEGGISPLIGEPYPETLASFDELGVEFISDNPPNEGEEGLLDDIDNQSEVGLWAENFKQRIVEAAIGNRSESYDDIMEDLNVRWQEAQEQLYQGE
ncbi:ABC transporter substrate-binding protein [Bacillus sp. TS-2]|nr:ABC transporter substrate-binding protein [Bacillus sp. TS-2]